MTGALGQSLGMATVAEGVETEEQLSRITADGCTDVQGYLISRPIAPAQIDGFLSSRSENAAGKSPGSFAVPDQRKRRRRRR